MKKILLSALVIISFGVYVLMQRQSFASNTGLPQNPSGQSPSPDGVLTSERSLGGDPTAQNMTPVATDTPAPTPIYTRDEEDDSKRIQTPTFTKTPTPQPTPTPAGQSPLGGASKYKNGTFTSSSVDASYGNVQIKVTFQNDKITQVVFLDYPKDRSHSLQLSQYAVPQLTSEAIKAQSAQVDIISGATLTSMAFQQALQETISQARV